MPAIEARGHCLNVQSPSRPVVICGDRKRLVQVITNLLQNAAKSTSPGGRIALEVECAKNEIFIKGSDTGTGIDVKLLPHIFDLFTQGKRSSDRSQGGLGLGLALVKSLVGLHGGRVAVASPGSGQGASFTVVLPTVTTIADSHPHVAQNGAAVPTKNPLRLLVVDDNIDAANTLAMLLETAGHVVSVEHGSAAVLTNTETTFFDVYLLDIGLPDIDGNELARRLRATPRTARATLIAVTGYGQQYDKNTSIGAGFDYYFIKPANPSKLIELLASIEPV